MNKLKAIEERYLRKDIPEFGVGDTVTVYTRIKESDEKTRLHPYQGIVIARQGAGLQEAITVRKISSGEGIERVFPLHSKIIDHIDVSRRGKVRRAKLYYLRGKVGKKATKIKARNPAS